MDSDYYITIHKTDVGWTVYTNWPKYIKLLNPLMLIDGVLALNQISFRKRINRCDYDTCYNHLLHNLDRKGIEIETILTSYKDENDAWYIFFNDVATLNKVKNNICCPVLTDYGCTAKCFPTFRKPNFKSYEQLGLELTPKLQQQKQLAKEKMMAVLEYA